jgi:integrase
MSNDITTTSGRKKLKPRREPYWERIEAGAFLGYRQMTDGKGTWIARWRNEAKAQKYHAVGTHSDFDSAAKEARAWFKQCVGGSSEVVTVAEACRRYVADRRSEKGELTAKDAEGRFRRLIFNAPIGRIELSKLNTAHLTDWRNKQAEVEDDDEDDPDAPRKAKDSANRNIGTLKAALNLAYRMGLVSSTAQWDRVESFKGVGRRRERFLTMTERKTLFAAASPALKRLINALLLTGARPGEIANAKVQDLDTTGLLTLDGKTGRRTVPLSPKAFTHLKDCAGDRSADQPLLIQEMGQAWSRFDWRDQFVDARVKAGLPDEVVLYSIRHCAISEMLAGGIDALSVARLSGTSIVMIQKHYGHLIKDSIVGKLAKIKMM